MDAKRLQELLAQMEKAQAEVAKARELVKEAQENQREKEGVCKQLGEEIAREIGEWLPKPTPSRASLFEEDAPAKAKRTRRTKAEVEADKARLETAILHVLGKAEEPMGAGAIISKSGCEPSPAEWAEVIGKLITGGKISRTGEKAATVYSKA